jgi:hypothetical protein
MAVFDKHAEQGAARARARAARPPAPAAPAGV